MSDRSRLLLNVNPLKRSASVTSVVPILLFTKRSDEKTMRIFRVYCPYVFIDLLDLFLTTEDTESTEEDKKILKCTFSKAKRLIISL